MERKRQNSSRRKQWGYTSNGVHLCPWRFLPFTAWEKEKLRKGSLGARTAGVTSALSQPKAHKVNLPKIQLWLHHWPAHTFIFPSLVKRESSLVEPSPTSQACSPEDGHMSYHILHSAKWVPFFKHTAPAHSSFHLHTLLFPPLQCPVYLTPSPTFPSFNNESKGHLFFNQAFAHPLKFKWLFMTLNSSLFLRSELRPSFELQFWRLLVFLHDALSKLLSNLSLWFLLQKTRKLNEIT